MSIIRKLHSSALDDFERNLADLMTMAIFWCMRSCEYLKVKGQKDRKTKLLCLRNFRFFNGSNQIEINSKDKYSAKVLDITFEDQKNGEKFESVHCQKSSDKLLCPVKAAARIIDRILESTPNIPLDIPINYYNHKGKIFQVTSDSAIEFLRRVTKEIGEHTLGFKPNEIGIHSIRSGGAMALCLNGVEQYKIQIIGRWKSDSFMKYIRRQIEQFSEGLSNLMIQNESFLHIKPFKSNGGQNKF